MSGDSSSSKTEQPTPKKIRDAREKGQVAKSKEVVSLVLLLAIMGCFWLFSESMYLRVRALFELPQRYASLPLDQVIFPALMDALMAASVILAPILVTTFLFAIIANVAQTGGVFSGESIKPKLQNISFVNGFKKIFSPQNALEFVKSIIKIAVLSYMAWYVLKSDMQVLMNIPECGAECALYISGSMLMKLILYCLGVFIFLAGADFGLERFMYFKKLMMSIDEVRREYKETEGSPEIKGRRKELHRELMNEEVVKKRVTQSDVLITNPTHFAVGIRYDQELSQLPFIMIKGEMKLAEKIKGIAKKADVPIVENIPLARALYAKLEIDEKITEEFVEPVADVIRWLRDQSDA
ncbi:type III secretion system export apparatus subunit SctU [Marinibactrum halimedae]|uniref:EscU/YscU/HrcU family type III secretion system export apparatus switch protein n=1 Tax=Marinibactrum halimedae TaxID=1444977 RepID=A0AA37WK95_9GAMM|nr:type III secretion system export apparatus subunit SctU [Marinibactrum halimedae]MCD9459077.1 type III secretion system export apparatus subunit SctU [Marinibactrum halimedae]GLS24678.1 EscU/YscU/HrcU family type III secretion system export apparatus switch protein [Marinibactrum halimedae]